jgi:hypothetical protein
MTKQEATKIREYLLRKPLVTKVRISKADEVFIRVGGDGWFYENHAENILDKIEQRERDEAPISDPRWP